MSAKGSGYGRRGLQGLFGPGNLTPELALSYRCLTQMYNAGLPLPRAVGILAAQTTHPVLRETFEEALRRLEEGNRLSDTMNRFPAVFPPLHASLISVGENTGSLHLILARLAEQAEKAQELQQKLRSALTYPLVIFAIAMVLLVVAPAFVFKDLLRFLTELGVELPWPTRLLVWLSNLARSPSFPVGILVALGLLALLRRQIQSSLAWQRRWEDVLLALPAIGPATRAAVSCYFTRALAACVGTGVPLLGGLGLAGRSTDHLGFQERLKVSIERLRDGASLGQALADTGFLSRLTLTMIRVGEDSGKLSEMLERATRISEDQLEHALVVATALLQPLMLLFIGFTVGFLVIATMTPLLKVVEAF